MITMEAETGTRAFRPEMAASVGSATETPGWDLATERRVDDGQTLANGLGWFSVGLGLYQVAAPRRLAGWLGMDDSARLIQAYGVREIVKGVGLLANRRPAGWMWGRVAGDVLDLATLAPGLDDDNPRRGNVAVAVGAVAGVMMLDLLCARQLSRRVVHD